jgi:leucyl aminopeptidase
MNRPPFEFSKIPLTGFPNMHVKLLSSVESLAPADIFVTCHRTLCDESTMEKDILNYTSSLKNENKLHDIISELLRRKTTSVGEFTMSCQSYENNAFKLMACLNMGKNPSETGLLQASCSTVSQDFEIGPYQATDAGKALGIALGRFRVESIVLFINSSDVSPLSLQCFISTFCTWIRPDDRFKKQKYSNNDNVYIIIILPGISKESFSDYEKHVNSSTIMSYGERLTRELVNTPANICTTESLANECISLASSFETFSYKILDEDMCKELSMGAYLAVAQGSLYKPQFIHLIYTPFTKSVQRKIAIIGKGICMDTGGYNLKVGANIEQMKYDMGGAAAVMGAAQIIGLLRPQHVQVHFIIPAAENMISARSCRPGDIVKASNGMSIEIGNTDAEGRLTLADALHYACNEVHPDYIFDCATLTGACKVALGDSIAALYGTHSCWTNIVLER